MVRQLRILRLACAEATLSPLSRYRSLEPGEADVWLLRGSVDRRGRLARRLILARYAGVEPSRIQIEADRHGKPYLADPTGTSLHFNVSHSADLIAVAVCADGPLGIDVERRRLRRQVPLLAGTVLTARERAWWRQQGSAGRRTGFYDLWSAKEACAKLTGYGLSSPFGEIAIAAPGAASSSVETGGSGSLRVCQLPLGDDFSGALAWSPAPAAAPD